MEGDGEANYAYFALHELGILPHDLASMDIYQKAAIFAMIDVRIEKEKRERKKKK
ncbi:MAG: hypothetical protein E6230_02590 [Paenibacillus dendritiformis]|uniref:hypothetical protein n=1 Tax=uncultured Paenibacillus sp. TaxID=227322 RepID=UPI0025F06D3C|nr:hypothetical protein [uncultured Paenibacillus sp.]MDU5141061.1 hypothetical protein [Paenibacillus dendritiformis]